jgi:DNA uptake protein ComE-like DNA-binding protein
MARDQIGVETKPYVLSLNKIEIAQDNSGITKKTLNKIADILKADGSNAILPIACLAEELDKYQLLTGLGIYEAAKAAGLKEIWVFLIAEQQTEAKKWLAQANEFVKLNQVVVDSTDVSEFLEFINNKDSDLTSVKGIGTVLAEQIVKNRPYKSLENFKDKFGQKRPLNWIRNFQQAN